jgi:hypothetical protein
MAVATARPHPCPPSAPGCARRLHRSLRLPGGGAAALLVLAPWLGCLVAHSYQDLALHAFHLTSCRLLVTADTFERLAAAAASADGRLLLTAGASGGVALRWLHSLQASRGGAGKGRAAHLPVESLAARKN